MRGKKGTMIKILFVCHGNICRSPMAEFYMKDLVRRMGREGDFYISSAATSAEETGNPVHPGTRRILDRLGISCAGKRARRLTAEDYTSFDYLIGMDSWNIRNMRSICGGDPDNKIYKLLDFTDKSRDVADPWYTGDFEATFQDVSRGCAGLLETIRKSGAL